MLFIWGCLSKSNLIVTFHYSALEDVMPDDAIQLYTDVFSILEEDGKEHMAYLYRAETSVYIKLKSKFC